MDRIMTQLAYLVARGLPSKTTARLMELPEGEVCNMADKLGFRFLQPKDGIMLSGKASMVMSKAAEVRGIPPSDLIEKVLNILGDDATLLSNVIDDGK